MQRTYTDDMIRSVADELVEHRSHAAENIVLCKMDDDRTVAEVPEIEVLLR